MAGKRKGKLRKEEFVLEKEHAIAKWLRKNVPTKKTKFLYHNVEYFTAVKAVDALMETQWVNPKEGDEAFFTSRANVVLFLDRMLRHKFFHRAKKVRMSEQELKAKLKKKDKERKHDGGEEKSKKEEDKGDADAESSHAEGEKKEETSAVQYEEKEKKKRKIRLEMHLEQLFVDGLDAYVWIYDPIPVYYWFFGTLLVLAATAICLFPLWPPSVRKGVYYLRVAAVGFPILPFVLAVVRLVVFCALWALTFGRHHFWLFPNLTVWRIYQTVAAWVKVREELFGVSRLADDIKSYQKLPERNKDNINYCILSASDAFSASTAHFVEEFNFALIIDQEGTKENSPEMSKLHENFKKEFNYAPIIDQEGTKENFLEMSKLNEDYKKANAEWYEEREYSFGPSQQAGCIDFDVDEFFYHNPSDSKANSEITADFVKEDDDGAILVQESVQIEQGDTEESL